MMPFETTMALLILLILYAFVIGYVYNLTPRPEDVYRCSNCSVPHFYGTCTSSGCVDYHKYMNPKYIHENQKLATKEDEQ